MTVKLAELMRSSSWECFLARISTVRMVMRTARNIKPLTTSQTSHGQSQHKIDLNFSRDYPD